ncbi:Uncharacterized protein LW94_6782 [Fusarium fujikuroi]|nr:Uncharacterized protein LW94_6782 [Fusarium fujikuroi]SCO42970.1 uncharacterized protein FFMR_07130 [Fusarium fujikuroi]SCV32029.1 uncharacterized protein FFFS_03100 [Fusarium fujikuroi]
MPARATNITIVNNTSQDFHGGSGSLVHVRRYGAESDGIMSGDEGWVNYKSAAGDMKFHFDNPFIGDNSYDTTGPDHFNISKSGGDGNECHVTWTITEKVGHGHK